MPAVCEVRKNRYFDSVFLMQVAQRMQNEANIEQAAVLMGTDKNKQLLSEMGFKEQEFSAADAADLVVALRAPDDAALQHVLEHLDEWLVRPPSKVTSAALHTLDEGLACQPRSNLAVISIPGAYAGKEAHRALERGLNVFIFSSNVSLEEELSLKLAAREQGLIVMGPDCGTSIIGGVGIGFANAVRRGPIGVVGPSGTGLQEFTTVVHRCGSGISHAIGTGSRDLSDAVGGITTLQAFDVLEADLGTRVIGIVSKPPGDAALTRLMERANRSTKLVVACFLGTEVLPDHAPHVHLVQTLDEAAAQAAWLAGAPAEFSTASEKQWQQWLDREAAAMRPEQTYIRGLFAGGTFCYQAQHVLRSLGLIVNSNAPIPGMRALDDPVRSVGHILVDLGAEFFTDGRPHPMIDGSVRRERILAEAHDPAIGVLLLDFVLGYNAAPDPAGDMIESIREAKQMVARRGGYLPVLASITGTDADFQNFEQQVQLLNDAGVVLLPSAAKAARFAGELVADGGRND